MSHQFTLATQIKEKSVLLDTLKQLGYSYQENQTLVDWQNKNIGIIDLLVKVGNSTNRVGFKYDENTSSYNLVGDFHALGMSEKTFCDNVKKNYISNQVKSLLKKKRFTIVEDQVTNSGSIKMRARSMIA